MNEVDTVNLILYILNGYFEHDDYMSPEEYIATIPNRLKGVELIYGADRCIKALYDVFGSVLYKDDDYYDSLEGVLKKWEYELKILKESE